ncbi:MAG: anhydro-N-acetylmuramic acid kinase [Pseudomonadota bacterium]
MNGHYIGLMSGTSMDAVDAVLVEFSSGVPTLRAHHGQSIPTELRARLLAVNHGENTTVARIGELDARMGRLFAETVQALLRESGMAARDIRAIGSHGQTIYHCPDGDTPTSVQIGDPNLIAELTGITTVADFRRRDIAAGGQGAPLVPAFHQAVFRAAHEDRVVANIGGIANITVLPRAEDQAVRGFDTGPGNALMDYWIKTHRGEDLDEDGCWAATGQAHAALLEMLLDDAYFSRQPPKSTGREYFHPAWLNTALSRLASSIAPADVQATLCELTAVTLTEAINEHAPVTQRVLICGGGAYNKTLMTRLASLLAPRPVESTIAFSIPPEWVEGLAFAWLARQTLLGLPGNIPSVTGARRAVVLGGIYSKQ